MKPLSQEIQKLRSAEVCESSGGQGDWSLTSLPVACIVPLRLKTPFVRTGLRYTQHLPLHPRPQGRSSREHA